MVIILYICLWHELGWLYRELAMNICSNTEWCVMFWLDCKMWILYCCDPVHFCSIDYYAVACRKGAISIAFCPSVCLSVAYIANNLRTRRPSMPKFGRKVPHLRCELLTSFKVKRSKIRVRGGWGHTVLAEPGGHTACFVEIVNNLVLVQAAVVRLHGMSHSLRTLHWGYSWTLYFTLLWDHTVGLGTNV